MQTQLKLFSFACFRYGAARAGVGCGWEPMSCRICAGMPVHQRIFNPFYGLADRTGGSGLGCNLVVSASVTFSSIAVVAPQKITI